MSGPAKETVILNLQIMKNELDIYEIKAEVLLNYLYPDLSQEWVADYKGTFYRNYSEDAMRIDEQMRKVVLSRDGFLRLLPQGLISDENELRGKDFSTGYEALQQKKNELVEFFRPVDSFSFRNSVHMEAQVADLLEARLDYVLNRYFDVDRRAEKNAYVKQIMPLLPYVSRLRADFSWLRDMLETLTGFEVSMKFTRYDWTGRFADSQPMVRYELWRPGLDKDSYAAFVEELSGLKDFVREWFIPFDTLCEIDVKEDEPVLLDKGLLLDYNTRLNS